MKKQTSRLLLWILIIVFGYTIITASANKSYTANFGTENEQTQEQSEEPTEPEENPTFYIDSVSYEFENGMTFGEWIDSDYNTANYYVTETMIVRDVSPYLNWLLVRMGNDNYSVALEDMINTNYSYFEESIIPHGEQPTEPGTNTPEPGDVYYI